MGDSTTSLAGALQLYDRWAEDPRVELVAEPRGAETLFRRAIAPFALQTATKTVADCYLIGFAEAAGAHVVTFDRGLAATAIFRQVPVALLEPVEVRKRGGRPSE
jgi:predicted nucleic acid-binding protein